MDSLLANYASSDEEEHQQRASPPQRIPPAKPVTLEAKAGEEKDEGFFPKSTSKRSGIFDSLPEPKSSLFNSIPPPKSRSFPSPKPQAGKEAAEGDEEIVEKSKPKSSSSSSLFSSLPRPKSSSSSSAAKRVVQFRPPTVMNPYSGGVDDEEDDDVDESEKERQRKRSKESISTSSATSFLSSIPAPKHSATLGVMPSASGTGRRSMLETNADTSVSIVSATGSDAVVNSSVGYLKDQSNEMNYNYSSWSSGSESNAYYSGFGAVPDGNVGSDPVSSIGMGTDAGMNSNVGHSGNQSNEIYDHSSSLGDESYAYYGGYGVGSTAVSSVTMTGSDAGVDFNAGSYEAIGYSYGSGHVEYANYGGSHGEYGNNAQYENNWASATALPEVSGVVENPLQVPGKRGRRDAPPQIVEVKQDELIKNRPREDQVKLTGIAFGPAYQPASTKGKPSKLHKRKHQIGSLYFEMKQKETELAERRSKGFLTKAQTQAKYGW